MEYVITGNKTRAGRALEQTTEVPMKGQDQDPEIYRKKHESHMKNPFGIGGTSSQPKTQDKSAKLRIPIGTSHTALSHQMVFCEISRTSVPD